MANREPAPLITRAQIEDFLYFEAELLDSWELEKWLELLTDDASYYVPPNDRPDGSHADTLFLVADDTHRIRSRVKRLLSKNAHAENPRSRTKRMIHNVRIVSQEGATVHAKANFVVYRFRRNSPDREYVGTYYYQFHIENGQIKIKERRAVLEAEELGSLYNISFIL